MKRKTIIGALVLFAGAAYAQPTPIRHPPVFTYATAPACAAGEAKLYALSDSGSCSADDAGTGVICQCADGTVSAVGSGSGSASNSFETINAPAGTDPVADSATDTLNVTCAGGLTCTGDSATDTLDFTMGTASAATALAANGANCSAGQYPLGVDASGAVETCTADDDLPDADEVTEAMLKSVNAATDEYLLTYESTTGDFEWAQHAPTASALAADPADCAANQYANAIAASGALTCAAIADADVPDGITVTLAGTATALAANGANCSAGQYPLGVDASGAAESCAADDDVPDAGEVAVSAIANGTDGELITWGADGVATTVAVGTATQVLTSNGAGAAPTFQDAAGGGIGGSTGATDDAILIADGVGGATAAASAATLTAAGSLTIPGAQSILFGGLSPISYRTDVSALTLGGTNVLWLQPATGKIWIPANGGLLISSSGDPAGATVGFFRGGTNTAIITNGSTGIGNLLSGVLVEANTAGSGAPNVIAANESGTLFTNEGATAENFHTLPTAAAGYVFEFCVQDADGLRIVSGASDTIRVLDKVTAATGYIESSTIGSCVRLVSLNAVEWFATSIHGEWGDGTFSYSDVGNTTP